jgi:hypothetical protein
MPMYEEEKEKTIPDTVLNYHLYQNLKLIRMSKFDHLIDILTNEKF